MIFWCFHANGAFPCFAIFETNRGEKKKYVTKNGTFKGPFCLFSASFFPCLPAPVYHHTNVNYSYNFIQNDIFFSGAPFPLVHSPFDECHNYVIFTRILTLRWMKHKVKWHFLCRSFRCHFSFSFSFAYFHSVTHTLSLSLIAFQELSIQLKFVNWFHCMPNKSVFIYSREMNSDASSIINKNSSIFIHVNMIVETRANNVTEVSTFQCRQRARDND